MSFQASTNPALPRPQAAGDGLAGAAIGAALALLGGSVAAGWLLRAPALLQLLPELTPMVLSTAICFVLAGAWLGVAALRPRWRAAAAALAGALFALAGAATLQYLLGVDLGVDAAPLHLWLALEIPNPGRMSAFTAAAFLAASLAMLLAKSALRPARNALAATLATVPGAIGVLALIGYLFELHLVYARYPLGLVALHTAVGLVALCVGLWLRLLSEGRIPLWQRMNVQDRITFASAAILTLTLLAAAVTVFAALEGRVRQALREGLATSLRYKVLLAEAAIDAGLQRTRILVGRPAPARLLRRHGGGPGDAEAFAQLRQSAESLLADGYLAGVYYDVRGARIVAAGTPLEDPELAVALHGVPGATLSWKNRFIIAGRYPISDSVGEVGSALVETPLPALDEILADSYQLGETGEAGMCARVDDRLGCFPQPRIPKVYYVPTRSSDGAPLPMTMGLSGKSGVVLTRDYRGENVMAAYAPVGTLGLAMVTKIDTAEIYAPVRQRLQILLPALIVLIGAGTLLLRTRVRPLAARLADSEREAQERHQALEAMMANVADGIMLLDPDGTIRSWNAAAERLFGFLASEIVGRNVSILVPEDLRESNILSTHRFLATGQSNVVGRGNLSYPALRKDGSRFELEFAVTRMGGGRTPQLVAVFRDVTQRKAEEHRLTQLAMYDALTGLPNRASFERRVEEALHRRRRGDTQLAIMLMDVDNFKRVNDSLGHAAGDLLLAGFAKRLVAGLRDADMVARFGGDEFTIVAEGLKDAGDALAIADKILAAMREPFHIDGRNHSASTSIGIALYRDGDTRQTLMKRADAALYEAKGAGRARHHLAP